MRRLAGVMSVVLLACAPLRGAPAKTAVRAADPVTIALPGEPVMVTLAPADDSVQGLWMPRRAPRVTTPDGEAVASSLVFIAIEPPRPAGAAQEEHGEGKGGGEGGGDGGGASATLDWLPGAPAFTVRPYSELASSRRAEQAMTEHGAGAWVLICDVPPDVRLDALVIDGQRSPLRVLSGERYRAEEEPQDLTPAERGAVAAMVRPLASQPLQRWRVRLLEERLGKGTLWGGGGGGGGQEAPGAIEPRELEVLATRIEGTWRSALALIAEADERTAAELVRALTGVARLPSGVLAPVWPAEEGDHGVLLRSLTAPGLKGADAARRARAYLNSLAPVRVTVMDDNQGVAGVTELLGRDAEAQVAGTRVSIPAFASRVAVIPEAPDAGGASSAPIRCGSWSAQAAAINGAPAVRPPGFRLGPLYTPWTLTLWRQDRPMPTLGEQACAALVQRAPGGGGEGGGGVVGDHAWQLYVECSTPHDAPSMGDEVVFYLGGGRAPALVRRVDAGGVIRDADGLKVGEFPTSFDHGRWWAIVEVPAGAIEPDGTLLIAMERRDASGWRATWPRPMLPGQERPAPVRLDLNA